MSSSNGSINVTIGRAGAATVLAAVALGLGALLAPVVTGGSDSSSCTTTVTTLSGLTSAVSSASAGDTVCIQSDSSLGDYNGAGKTSPGVTIKPADGSTPKLTINFANLTSAAWLTFDGVTIGGGHSTICGPAHNITVKNATITDEVDVETGAGPDDNNSCSGATAMDGNTILFDNDTFTMADDPTGASLSHEGRLSVLGGTSGTSPGVTIQDSAFDGNCADGVQTNTQGGFLITGSEFKNLLQASCSPHVDSIQFVGARDVTITNSYFHNDQSGVAEYNGFDAVNMTISNNVFDTIPPEPPDVCAAVCVCQSTGLTVTHNTFVNGSDFVNCSADDPSTGVVSQDNILTEPEVVQGSSSFSTRDHNLCMSGTCTGTGSLNGTPTWTAGASPTTYAGFALAAGSLGKGSASDGTDIGVNP